MVYGAILDTGQEFFTDMHAITGLSLTGLAGKHRNRGL